MLHFRFLLTILALLLISLFLVEPCSVAASPNQTIQAAQDLSPVSKSNNYQNNNSPPPKLISLLDWNAFVVSVKE